MAAALAYSSNEPRPDGPTLLPLPPRPPMGRESVRSGAADSGELSARDIYKALRYHSILFITLGTLVAAAGAAAGWTLFPARYTTYAMLRVESTPPSLLEANNGTTRGEFSMFIGTQAGLIKSHKIMNRTVRKPEVLSLPMLQGLDDPVSFLEEKVLLEYSERSELLKVTMAGEDPAQITKVVNGVVDAFLTEVETYKQEKQVRYDRLLRAKGDAEKALDTQMKDYAAQFRAPAGNEAKAKTRQTKMLRFLQLQSDETRIRADLNRARELLALAQARQSQTKQDDLPMPEIEAQIETDPAVAKKMADLERIEKYLANYRRVAPNPNSDHALDYERRVAKERGELEEMKKQKTTAYKRALLAQAGVDGQASTFKLQGDLERLTIDEKNVKEELRGFADLLAEEPVAGPPPEQTLAEIRLKTAQEHVSRLEHETKIQKAELEADDRVKLIEKASVPQNREMKKQIAFTGFGGIAGFALVGALITAGELRRKRVYGHTDTVFNQLPLLGRIPEHGFVRPSAGAEPAGDDHTGLAFREAVDRVKTLTLRNMTKNKMQSLLVTSPGADEGKSILAWNLAAGFARTDYRVLFIDANLHAPTIHQHLDIAMPLGLAEALRGDRTLPEVVLRTPVANLFCLTAGGVNDEAHRALDKGAMQKLLERAKKDFDLIVIDSCAMNEAVDPLYIAQRVDAAVLSLRTFRSRVDNIEQACRRLKLLGTPILGAVLTDPTLNEAQV